MLSGVLCCAVVLLACPESEAQLYADSDAFQRIKTVRELTALLEDAYQKSLDRGMPNFVPYTIFLVRRAYAALQDKMPDHALLYAEYAKKFSPDIPLPDITRAKIRWSANRFLVNRFIAGYVRELLHRLSPSNIDEFCFLIVSNGAVMAAALLLSLLAMTCISLLRYVRLCAHDLRHMLPSALPVSAVYASLVVLLLLPLFLGASLFVSCIIWLLLLYTYHTRRERIAVAVLIGLCGIALPIFACAVSFCMFMPANDQVRLPWKVQYRYWTPRDIEALERLHVQHPDDADILFTLGLAHAKDGNYRTAQKYYEKLLRLNPQDYQVHTNIGNVLLATHNWDAAVEHYRQAVAAAPRRCAAAHFNLARAYQQRFLFQEAERELEAAKNIDRAAVDWHLTIYSEQYNRLLMHERLPVRRLWERGYHLFLRNTAAINSVWNLVCRGIPVPYAAPLFLAALWFSAFGARREKIRLATACSMCGRPLCKRCQRVVAAELMCMQCLNFLKKQDTLGYKLKEEKVAAIKKHLRAERHIGTVAQWLVPGAGHIWKGRPITGTCVLFMYFLLLCKMGALLWFEGPGDFADSFAGAETVFAGFCLIMVWVWAVGRGARMLNKRLEANVLLKNIALDLS